MKTKYGNLIQFASDDTQQATFSGTTYRKQIAKFGEWVNPDYPWFSDDPIMTLDKSWATEIVNNFNNNTLGSPVPVPLNHTSDVKENTGEVLSLEIVKGKGLFANLKISDEATIEKLDRGIIFDVSISFVWDFTRTDGNKSYGATLLHVALVNTPYLVGMDSFEKVGAALSRLEDSFKPLGLSLSHQGVMMLSRNKIKELSGMTDSTIKNDRDFDVVVSYIEDEEEKEATVEAGAEIVVPEAAAEDVSKQILEAEEKADDEAADEPAADETDETPKEDKSDSKDDEAPSELSRIKLENAELKLSKAYDDLLLQGKVTPAQKDKILGLAKLSQGVELSTSAGKQIDLSTAVLEILEAGAKQFSTEESGSDKEDPDAPTQDEQPSDENKKPSEVLSEAELAGFKAVGADPSKMDDLAEKDPVFREALKTLSKKYEMKGTK